MHVLQNMFVKVIFFIECYIDLYAIFKRSRENLLALRTETTQFVCVFIWQRKLVKELLVKCWCFSQLFCIYSLCLQLFDKSKMGKKPLVKYWWNCLKIGKADQVRWNRKFERVHSSSTSFAQFIDVTFALSLLVC